MTIEFKLPDLGENVESGDIVAVLVHEGDEVAKNQAIVEIETDKAVAEVPSSHAGKVTKVHVAAGQTVRVGDVLISLEAASAQTAAAPTSHEPPAAPSQGPEPTPDAPAAEQPGAPARPTAPTPRQPVAPLDSSTASSAERETAAVATATALHAGSAEDQRPETLPVPAGPATRRLARELGIELQHVHGTGPRGRITRDDLIAAVRQAHVGSWVAPPAEKETSPAARPSPDVSRRVVPEGREDRDKWGDVRRQPLSKIRRVIAENMLRSVSTIPHVTNFDDADVTELEKIRKGGMADYVGSDVKLTMLSFVIKAVAQSLKLHPTLNASLDMEHGEVIYKDYIHLGVAVDTERGLIVPVLRDVDRMTIPQIAASLSETAEKARANRFSLDDLSGGTFTVSNLGAVGGQYSTPIINPPEVGILLLGRSRRMPVADGEAVKNRLVMPLSLSYDHRLVDGAVAARFLNEVKSFLQIPGRLLLAS